MGFPSAAFFGEAFESAYGAIVTGSRGREVFSDILDVDLHRHIYLHPREPQAFLAPVGNKYAFFPRSPRTRRVAILDLQFDDTPVVALTGYRPYRPLRAAADQVFDLRGRKMLSGTTVIWGLSRSFNSSFDGTLPSAFYYGPRRAGGRAVIHVR